MPTELVRRIDWNLIYPPFMEKAFELAARCRARGSDYHAISGHRSFMEQARLYGQGRTTGGDVVTNAKPGWSAHNYGVAVDWCHDGNTKRAGLQPDWDLVSYEVLKEEAAGLGLESGMTWTRFREGPHVQLPLLSKQITFGMLVDIHEKGGRDAVWWFLDSRGPW